MGGDKHAWNRTSLDQRYEPQRAHRKPMVEVFGVNKVNSETLGCE